MLCVVLVCVAVGSSVRMGLDLRQQRLQGLFGNAELEDGTGGIASDSGPTWFSVDPDGLYHTRRVDRIFEDGFPVAATDAQMNYPHGAAIPWPPYYEAIAYQILRPFAPQQPQARAIYLEQQIAMLPFWFALLSIALLAWVAGKSILTGSAPVGSSKDQRLPARGLLAGLLLALSYGAAHYSAPGVGDHHAFVGLLTLLMFVLVSASMREGVLDRPRRAGMYGLTSGAIGGVLLGTWVASLLYVLVVQLAFGVLLMLQRKRPRTGLAVLGLSFHLAAFVVLLPAVLQSPWREEFPWMVVNLSWFHLAHLALGAVVFLPIRRHADGGRLHPLALPIAIVAALLLVTAIGVGPGAGIREGMAWVSRADEFMSGIAESEPLWNGEALTWIGFGLLVLPFAWLTMLRAAVGKKEVQHWVWLIAVPLLLLQALTQRRFADVLAAPMAWMIAWAVFEWSKPLLHGKANPAAPMALKNAVVGLALATVVGVAAQAKTLPMMGSPFGNIKEADPLLSAYREVYEWIGEQPKLDAQESVLATWDQGHSIEWLSKRGSVATNFGTYVGEDSYRDPSRFFLGKDFAAAEQILQQRKTRYVVRTSQLPLAMDGLSRALQSDEIFVESFTTERGKKRDRLTPRWFQSMAAILWMPLPPRDPRNPVVGTGMGDPDGPTRPQAPIDFLRLVHLSPVPDDDPRHGGLVYPAAAVWEYVPGAKVAAQLQAGHSLTLKLGLTATFHEQALMSFEYQSSANADASGEVQIRLPYSTEANGNGGALYVNEGQYSIQNAAGQVVESGQLSVSEADVLQGRTVTVKKRNE